ncbi:hypothetical protein [Mesorhizobium sp. SP-1A]|uniref:hypothetical protein n=1 Tax=Mesorhizobium sp. SP-1A TaxID=3077840 RepID=UPI0028F71395|nr:hypothetical protein [Mesorhizobium sp. SP-1A]
MARILLVAIAAIAPLLVPAGAVAANIDSDWPCVQRKVPRLSVGEVWNGPELPKSAADWEKDTQIATLVAELSARRMPLDEARKRIKDLVAAQPADQLTPKLEMLMQGLFDHMDSERTQVMEGIARYARKQAAMAADLRKQSAALDVLATKADADPAEIERQTDRFNFATRIYDERRQSLSSVCEVPTIIGQRLYQLARAVREALPKQ